MAFYGEMAKLNMPPMAEKPQEYGRLPYNENLIADHCVTIKAKISDYSQNLIKNNNFSYATIAECQLKAFLIHVYVLSEKYFDSPMNIFLGFDHLIHVTKLVDDQAISLKQDTVFVHKNGKKAKFNLKSEVDKIMKPLAQNGVVAHANQIPSGNSEDLPGSYGTPNSATEVSSAVAASPNVNSNLHHPINFDSVNKKVIFNLSNTQDPNYTKNCIIKDMYENSIQSELPKFNGDYDKQTGIYKKYHPNEFKFMLKGKYKKDALKKYLPYQIQLCKRYSFNLHLYKNIVAFKKIFSLHHQTTPAQTQNISVPANFSLNSGSSKITVPINLNLITSIVLKAFAKYLPESFIINNNNFTEINNLIQETILGENTKMCHFDENTLTFTFSDSAGLAVPTSNNETSATSSTPSTPHSVSESSQPSLSSQTSNPNANSSTSVNSNYFHFYSYLIEKMYKDLDDLIYRDVKFEILNNPGNGLNITYNSDFKIIEEGTNFLGISPPQPVLTQPPIANHMPPNPYPMAALPQHLLNSPPTTHMSPIAHHPAAHLSPYNPTSVCSPVLQSPNPHFQPMNGNLMHHTNNNSIASSIANNNNSNFGQNLSHQHQLNNLNNMNSIQNSIYGLPTQPMATAQTMPAANYNISNNNVHGSQNHSNIPNSHNYS